jgi:2-C-methyl-D-erythritol 4-phosphate cytidylyltransferase
MPSLAVILPAAGRSVRFGRGRNKLLELLAGRPVVAHTVAAFAGRRDVGCVVIATTPGDGQIEAALAEFSDRDAGSTPLLRFCPGGASRAQSVLRALEHVPPGVEWVAVHDAARPLVSQDLIDRTLAAARAHGCAVPALPVPLTIKQADGPLPAKVQRTVPRQSLWAMQTPQIMRRDELLAAFQTCPLPPDQATDDAQLLELAGRDVWLVPGDERNLKITTALDLRMAELLLEEAGPW